MSVSRTTYCEEDCIEDVLDLIFSLFVSHHFFSLGIEGDGDWDCFFDELAAFFSHVFSYLFSYLLIESSK